MSRFATFLTHVATAAIACSIVAVIGCTSVVVPQIDAEDAATQSQPVNLRGRSFSYALGTAGEFELSTGQTVTQATPYQLFDNDPIDRPRTAMMTLSASDVGVQPMDAGNSAARAAPVPLNGEVSIRFLVASGSGGGTCDNGVLLADFDATFATGVAAIADESYEIDTPALEIIRSNNVTVCMEASSNFDASVTVAGFELSFMNDVNTAELTLQNTGTAAINLLAPDEVFSPGNLLAPGASRVVVVDNPVQGYAIRVRAGRDFTVLQTAQCPVVAGTDYTADVLWDGETLSCAAEQDAIEQPPTITPETRLQLPIENLGGVAIESDPTATYGSVDYAVVGVLSTATPDAPAGPSAASVDVDLEALGLTSVEALYIATASSYVADLADGVTVATLTLDFVSGLPTKVRLNLGENTAEWSYDRPEHADLFGRVRHDRAYTLYTFDTTVDSQSEYNGSVYRVYVDLGEDRELTSITLTGAGAGSVGSRSSLVENPTWFAQDILAVTLIGQPAGLDLNDDGIADDAGVIVNDLGDDQTPAPEPEPEPTVFGDITGTVVDAQSGNPLAGVVIGITGTELVAATDANGLFTVNHVPVGTQSLTATLAGYITNSMPAAVAEEETLELSIGLLQFGVGGDNVAAVLTWGNVPNDLDLHMSGPDGAGGRFHAYFGDKNPVGHVSLDLDDLVSFGPETMTILPAADGNFVAGDYHVWIDNFSGSPQYDDSNATVTLFAAGAQVAQYLVGDAAGSPIFDIWLVIEFDVSTDGAITDLRVTQSFEGGGATNEF